MWIRIESSELLVLTSDQYLFWEGYFNSSKRFSMFFIEYIRESWSKYNNIYQYLQARFYIFLCGKSCGNVFIWFSEEFSRIVLSSSFVNIIRFFCIIFNMLLCIKKIHENFLQWFQKRKIFFLQRWSLNIFLKKINLDSPVCTR